MATNKKKQAPSTPEKKASINAGSEQTDKAFRKMIMETLDEYLGVDKRKKV